jgi:hypothetical protein
MAAATYDFTIEQGATLLKAITWKDSNGDPVDLTGYVARMQVRPSATSEDVLLDLSTDNGGLQLTPSSGVVTITASAEDTAALDWRKGKYDLELESADGTVTRLLKGVITVSREITR